MHLLHGSNLGTQNCCTQQESKNTAKEQQGMSHLHEVARDECLTYVYVIFTAGKLCARAAQIKAIHDPSKLLTHIVCTFKRSEVDEIVVTPLRIIVIFKNRQHVRHQ